MHKGRIKKRDQPVAPCNPFLPAVALLTLPFWQWLSFPAVSPLSSSGSSFLSGSGCFPMVLRCSALASKSFPMVFRHGAPASNKPHPAEKSTPVWLAIWRTWAGFANSQHRDAAFATPNNIYVPILLCCNIELLLRQSKSFGPSAPIAYATSVSPPDEAAAWPWAQVSGAG